MKEFGIVSTIEIGGDESIRAMESYTKYHANIGLQNLKIRNCLVFIQFRSPADIINFRIKMVDALDKLAINFHNEKEKG